MPDTLTEFCNLTATHTELLSGVDIVTTGASERAVVKDVRIMNSSGLPLTLTLGDFKLGSVDGDVVLSGTEILAPSAAMKLKALGVAFDGWRSINSTSVLGKAELPPIFPNGSGGNAVSSQTETISPSLTITPYFACFGANGDFYYAYGNSSGDALYRRAGGINGAQTTLNSFGHLLAYDGARYIYGFRNGYNTVLNVCDTTNGTVSTVTISPGLVASPNYNYGHCAAIDGYVLVKPSYNNSLEIINAATGAKVDLGVGYDNSANRFPVGIGKNAAGEYICVKSSYEGSLLHIAWWNIGGDLSAPFLSASGTLASSFWIRGDTNFFYRPISVDGALVVISENENNPIYVIDLDIMQIAFSAVPTAPVNLSAYLDYAKWLEPPREVDASIKVRATGVLVT